MKYILFGAGWLGCRAAMLLGDDNVECFADNFKHGESFMGKRIISFEEMKELAGLPDAFRVVVTSGDYADVLAKQLQEVGIDNYFVFTARDKDGMSEVLPSYDSLCTKRHMSYTDVLWNYKIAQYHRIVIYGANQYIEQLLFEIALQSDLKNVIGIVAPDRQEKLIMGIPVWQSIDASDKPDCLIINKRRTESGIRDEIRENMFDVVDLYDIDHFFVCNRHPELKRYKDIHKGKRAFIIGNGPSLTTEDLNILYKNREICFASNGIWKIYDRTQWRPTYFCLSDFMAIHDLGEQISQIAENSVVFRRDCVPDNGREIPNVEYIHVKEEEFEPNMPGFSEDITEGVYWGYTVTYEFALQIAAYMGFSEMYLLGTDHNYGNEKAVDSHFIPNYYNVRHLEIIKNIASHNDYETNNPISKANLAFQKAELYSRSHGFRIYNATRGGQLEVFERVDFDSLFK